MLGTRNNNGIENGVRVGVFVSGQVGLVKLAAVVLEKNHQLSFD